MILKKIAVITAIALSITVLQAQNNADKKIPEDFKEKILNKKDGRNFFQMKKSMSRGNHTAPSEIINLQWFNQNWDTISKDIITYKSGTNLASEIIVKDYTGNNTFTNYNSRNIKNYDQFNNLILDINEYWNSMNNTWEPTDKVIYEFDFKNNKTLEVNMSWNPPTNRWDTISGLRTTYSYNTNGDIITEVEENFNYINDNWEPSNKEVRDYNSDGFWVSTISQLYNGTAWENMFKDEYSVNLNGEWTEVVYYYWNEGNWESFGYKLNDITWYNFADLKYSGYIIQAFNGVFYANEEKYTWTYHSNGDYLLELHETWNGAAWENSSRIYNAYDSNDNITDSLQQEWNGSSWIMGSYGYKIAYTYDGDNNIQIIQKEEYNSNTETWENTFKHIYLYGTFVFSAGPDAMICFGDSAHINGSGGTTYNWTPTTGLSCNNCPSPKASPTITTEYIVTVTNGANSGTDTVRVIIHPLPIANAGSDEEICLGSNVNLYANGGMYYSWSPSLGLNNPNISNPLASPENTTIYTVTVKDGNNCLAQDDITITVNALPLVSFTGLDSFYCTTDLPVTLIGTPSGGTFNGPGITNIYFDPSLSGEGIHTITYTYTDVNECTNSSSQEVLINFCTGIKSSNLITNFSMHPNPSKGVFILSLSQTESKDVNIQITNLLGQKVFSRFFKEYNGYLKEEIDLTEYEQGIYLLQIESGKDWISKKIIIQ